MLRQRVAIAYHSSQLDIEARAKAEETAEVQKIGGRWPFEIFLILLYLSVIELYIAAAHFRKSLPQFAAEAESQREGFAHAKNVAWG